MKFSAAAPKFLSLFLWTNFSLTSRPSTGRKTRMSRLEKSIPLHSLSKPRDVQLLVSDADVESYKQIKADLDLLRQSVEKSELWVFNKGRAGIADESDVRTGAPGAGGATLERNASLDNVLDPGRASKSEHINEYRKIKEILERMIRYCTHGNSGAGDPRKPRRHEQRLLRNIGVHNVVLDLLQVPTVWNTSHL
ncbi:unnamed protein product [Plutella xylostella]|uniref:(diamondback moth) hypothetical protein n=1 Tax=Plutella xylostella TaxID=51655 RepID=A0A8S4GDY5_PLUXY|nr:unnamed protein product [Plutella xylostella]